MGLKERFQKTLTMTVLQRQSMLIVTMLSTICLITVWPQFHYDAMEFPLLMYLILIAISYQEFGKLPAFVNRFNNTCLRENTFFGLQNYDQNDRVCYESDLASFKDFSSMSGLLQLSPSEENQNEKKSFLAKKWSSLFRQRLKY